MAATINLGDIYSVITACYANGQVGLNRTHWWCSAATGTNQTDAQFATGLNAVLAPLYKSLIPATATYYGVKVVRKVPAPVYIPQVVYSLAGPGTAGGDLLPTQVCGLLQFRTSEFGKHGRGRQYIPFVPVPGSSGGLPDLAYITNLNLLGTELSTALLVGGGANTVTMTPVITGKAIGAPFFTVVSCLASGKFGNQYRRSDFGRSNVYPPF